tara:strand:- start:341 stop:1678 length:1338 start_codon:yes stop_codon:yes gene_type:complete
MSQYKPYPVYKDSGVEWLGRVPEHWQLRRLKQMARFYGGGTPSRDNPEFWNGDIPWVSPKDMKSEVISGAAECITAEGLSGSSSSMVEAERVLMVVRSGILKHTIPVAINDVPVALNQDMKAIWLDPCYLSSRFFMRWVQGLNDDLLKAWLKQGATVESIEQDYLSDTLIPVPPVIEREHIVRCLDREVARIDTLIEKKTRFIELLREKRQALITHAVTKGLDPSVKMKNSGVEWLGEVPEHWVCKKLMYWMDGYGSGTTPSKEGDYCMEGGIPWVTTGELREGLICETDKRVTDAALSEYSALKAHPVGSLVIAMYGATVGRLGLLGVPAALNQACFAIHPCKTISIRMLRWWFEGFRTELIELATGAGQPNISGDKIRNLFIAASLSLAEQEQIADQIESRTLRIDGLVSKTERSIEILKERRSALITAAVTGQIDLREQACH